MRRLATICLTIVIIWSTGCSKSTEGPPPAAKVKGTVTMGGGPIPVGEIHFGVPGFPPKVLEIKNGAFEGEVHTGDNKIEVFVYVEGPPSEKYKGAASKVNIVSDKYWGGNTTLAANVTAGGPNELKFELSAK